MSKKIKLNSTHYLKKVRRDLLAIELLPKTETSRFEKLKRRAAKNLEIAKELMKSE